MTLREKLNHAADLIERLGVTTHNISLYHTPMRINVTVDDLGKLGAATAERKAGIIELTVMVDDVAFVAYTLPVTP